MCINVIAAWGVRRCTLWVSVIDLSKADLSSHTDFKFGFYTILLSECKCEAYRYGHQYYDFSDGTLLCLTPGESISMKDSDNT